MFWRLISIFLERRMLSLCRLLIGIRLQCAFGREALGRLWLAGTGASAVCVACTLNGLVNEKEEIRVKLLGGDLMLKWDDDVFMRGPAKFVFEGVIEND